MTLKIFCLLAGLSLALSSLAFPPDSTKPSLTQVTLNEDMTNARLERLLKEVSDYVEGNEGYWQVVYNGRPILVITDAPNNRMRIISPVVEEKELKKSQFTEILEAQFDRALDVKYALFESVLWSVYAHPLKELTEDQFKDAISQVFYAAHNFGASYKSTSLQFGGENEENKD